MKMARRKKDNRGIYQPRSKSRKDSPAESEKPQLRRCEVCGYREDTSAPHQHERAA